MNYLKRSMMLWIGILLLAGCGKEEKVEKKAHGRIEIRSDKTEAEIYIDGKRVGSTSSDKLVSFSISLEEGEYTVRCVKDDNEGSKIVFVAPKSMQTVKVELDQLTAKAQLTKEKREQYPKIAPEEIKSELVTITPGSFMMGSPSSEKGRGSDEVQHKVTLTKAFRMGKYEVTQKQYQAIMGTNPSSFKGNSLPVEQVSWNAVVKFCKKLTELSRTAGLIGTKEKYTLPTEAQWEYACRAGTTTPFHYGDSLSSIQSNFYGKTTGIYRGGKWFYQIS